MSDEEVVHCKSCGVDDDQEVACNGCGEMFLHADLVHYDDGGGVYCMVCEEFVEEDFYEDESE